MIFSLIKRNFLKFIGLWLLVFILSFFLLSVLDLVPNYQEEKNTKNEISESNLEQKLINMAPALPKKVVIEKIGVDVRVNNPKSREIETLDNSLLSGAVRYPDSGLLGEKTNMLLFGHSSFLPIVRNENFKAFNNLRDLEIGDEISIFSDLHEFVYKIKSVEEADAKNALVVFESEKREVTLSTCNSFGNLDDRFVVKADLVDLREI